MNNSTTEYSKLLQKLDIILHDDNLNNNERRDQIVNEIINPLYDKAFDLIIEKDKLENNNKFEEVVALDLQVGDHFFFQGKEFVVREKDSDGCEAEVLEPDQLWEGDSNYLFILEIVDKKL